MAVGGRETGTSQANVVRFRASDVDAAQEGIASLYEPTAFDVNPQGAFLLASDAIRLGRVTVGRLSCSHPARLTTEVANHHVLLPIRGALECRDETGEVRAIGPEHAVSFMPGQRADTVWLGPIKQLCVMIPTGVLEREVEVLHDCSVSAPVRLQPVIDLREPQGNSWRDVVWLLHRELDRQEQVRAPGILCHSVVTQHLESLLLDVLVLSQKGLTTTAPLGGAPRASSLAIRRAMELIHDDPTAPWTTTALAGAVHVSVRSLQEGFKRAVGQTPTAYLRSVRLDGAHDDLRRAGRGELAVEEAALRWGFFHGGRFAAVYRERFGETPSETLRRR
jgi:AraC-like DNA-binding protein